MALALGADVAAASRRGRVRLPDLSVTGAGPGFTSIPSVTFCNPSVKTRSPKLMPISMIQRSPIHLAGLDFTDGDPSSAPTTATWYCPWVSSTARCGTSSASFAHQSGPHLRVNTGPQDRSGVREHALDLIVPVGGRSAGSRRKTVPDTCSFRPPAPSRDRARPSPGSCLRMLLDLARESEVLLLANREGDLDGVDLGNRGEQRRRVPHQVADLNGCDLGNPVDRRLHPRPAGD